MNLYLSKRRNVHNTLVCSRGLQGTLEDFSQTVSNYLSKSDKTIGIGDIRVLGLHHT